VAISPACPACRPPAATELADRVTARCAISVREAGVGDTEAWAVGAGRLTLVQAERVASKRRNEDT
jgi:hypothetical protein